MPRTPSTPSTVNQTPMIGPNSRPTAPVPSRCTRNRAMMITTVIGRTRLATDGAETLTPSIADRTEIAGVIMLSPKNSEAPKMPSAASTTFARRPPGRARLRIRAINAMIPPSPSLSARITSRTYVIVTTIVTDQKISEMIPKMLSSVTLTGWGSLGLKTVWTVYSGLVPMSPKTTPRAPRARAVWALARRFTLTVFPEGSAGEVGQDLLEPGQRGGDPGQRARVGRVQGRVPLGVGVAVEHGRGHPQPQPPALLAERAARQHPHAVLVQQRRRQALVAGDAVPPEQHVGQRREVGVEVERRLRRGHRGPGRGEPAAHRPGHQSVQAAAERHPFGQLRRLAEGERGSLLHRPGRGGPDLTADAEQPVAQGAPEPSCGQPGHAEAPAPEGEVLAQAGGDHRPFGTDDGGAGERRVRIVDQVPVDLVRDDHQVVRLGHRTEVPDGRGRGQPAGRVVG